MSLKYRVGDLITAASSLEVNVIGHCCNCFNTMKSGIAPLIAKEFPSAYQADQLTRKGDIDKLGRYSLGKHVKNEGTLFTSTGTLFIYNLYGQYSFGTDRQHLNYKALRNSLRLMCDDLNFTVRDNPPKIGFPKIGAGLAGGDWNIIEQIIEEELVAMGYCVTIYVLEENEIPTGETVI